MDITHVVSDGKNIINSYQIGKFLINYKEYFKPIVVFPEKIIELNAFDIDSVECIKSFLSEEIEILLIGSGKVRSMPKHDIKHYLAQQKNMNFEFMSTSSACRTYNVLISEGRFVVAYLNPIYD